MSIFLKFLTKDNINIDVEQIFEASMIIVPLNTKQIRKFQLMDNLNSLKAFRSTM
jgi:hypothetical protein